MSEEMKQETKPENVVEKRVTGTVIRRRAKRVVAPPLAASSEVLLETTKENTTTVAANDVTTTVDSVPTTVMPAEKSAVRIGPVMGEVVPELVKTVISDTNRTSPKSELEASVTVDAPKKVAAPIKEKQVDMLATNLKAPTDVERKIGVVGHIHLNKDKKVAYNATTESKETATTSVDKFKLASGSTDAQKEAWQEKLKLSRRKKSRAEMEAEDIQRAGGLKQYAQEIDLDVAASSTKVDRVFQPKHGGKRRRKSKDFSKTPLTERKAIKKVIRMDESITVAMLSQSLGIKAADIIKKMMDFDEMVTVNQNINFESASLIAEEAGFTVEHVGFKEESVLAEPDAHASAENLESRPPIITVMGHVDHGKTSVLDYIRKSNVTDKEAGGITQHIGAYEVSLPEGKMTFLDTPGHEAFTTMRARGAQTTDIVILVVAADDGLMPQTIEAIDHAKAAEVPIIIAINKIDKPEAQPERVKQSLTEHGLIPEEWGGDIICVNTSAITGEGINQLLEMVLIQSEMLNLKADPTVRAKGSVIEARLDKGRGPVATVLIQEGTLTVGSYIVCGDFDGKVRAMFDYEGKSIKEASLSKPVEILGLSGTPIAGDELVGVTDDKTAKLVAQQRHQKNRENTLAKSSHSTLEELSEKLQLGDVQELNLIIKADVQGSVEAVRDSLEKLSNEQVKIKVIHSQVGGIIESDIMLASASNAIVLGFNVHPDGKSRRAAEREKIQIKTYRIIYEILDEIRQAMEGLLAPEQNEVHLGFADVRDVFKVSKVGTIAGCYITDGKILRNARGRLLRDQVVVFDGKISSLKRFKDDAKEVTTGYECGIGIENYNDIKTGDVIEAYQIEEKAASLLS